MSLDKLSPELLTFVNNTVKEAIQSDKPLVFRRTGSDQLYTRSNPPKPRVMTKTYSPHFQVFDPFDKTNSNKTLIYTKGIETRLIGGFTAEIPKAGRILADERGFIRPDMSDTLAIACLLLSSKNSSFKYRDKSVSPDWYQVKEGVKGYAANKDLLKVITEHEITGIVLKMSSTELQSYATELQSSASVPISVNRPADELRTSLIAVVKKDPIFYGRFIPTPESNTKVLVMQAVNADVVIYDQTKRCWNFIHKWNKEEEGFATAGLSHEKAEEALERYLLSNEGKKLRKKIEKILFPSDDDGWEFLNDPKAVVVQKPAEPVKEEKSTTDLSFLLSKMSEMEQELKGLREGKEKQEELAPAVLEGQQSDTAHENAANVQNVGDSKPPVIPVQPQGNQNQQRHPVAPQAPKQNVTSNPQK